MPQMVADEESFHIVPLAHVCGICWGLAQGFWIRPVEQALKQQEKRLASSRPKMCKLATLGRSSFWGLEPPKSSFLVPLFFCVTLANSTKTIRPQSLPTELWIGDILLFKQSMCLKRRELQHIIQMIQVSWVALCQCFAQCVGFWLPIAFRCCVVWKVHVESCDLLCLWHCEPFQKQSPLRMAERRWREPSPWCWHKSATKIAVLQEKWHSLSQV